MEEDRIPDSPTTMRPPHTPGAGIGASPSNDVYDAASVAAAAAWLRGPDVAAR